MRRTKIYRCQITGYRLEYIIDTDSCAETGVAITDYHNMRAFVALLRSSIDQLKNNEGIKYIIQHVHDEEWDNFLKGKTSWTIITTDLKHHIYTIKCDIDDYLENYGVAIGI